VPHHTTSPTFVAFGPVVTWSQEGAWRRGRIINYVTGGVMIQPFGDDRSVYVRDRQWYYETPKPLPNRTLPPPTGRIPRLPG